MQSRAATITHRTNTVQAPSAKRRWAALVVLTAFTVIVSRFDFGSANTIVAMLVATVKATLVALFFMHLLYDDKFNLVILLTSLLFVAIFFSPVLIDLGSRGMIDPLKTRAGYKILNAKPSTLPEPAPEAAPAPAPAPAATDRRRARCDRR